MVLVAGATGSLGSKITRDLLERGFTVRALVRRTADYGWLADAGAEVVIGDLKDAASLVRACVGVDMVITSASATKRADDSPDNVDRKGNLNLIEAARVAGAEHFVLVSTFGASLESPVDAFRAKGAAEAALRASGMGYTILQPNAFMDVRFALLIELPLFQGEAVRLVGEAKARHSFIAEQDVAAFAIAALRHPAARNTTIPLGGPEAISFRDAVHAYEAALGREIPVRSIAPGAPMPGLPESAWGIAAALETMDSVIPMEATARTYGVLPTDARAFAAARAPAILQVAP